MKQTELTCPILYYKDGARFFIYELRVKYCVTQTSYQGDTLVSAALPVLLSRPRS